MIWRPLECYLDMLEERPRDLGPERKAAKLALQSAPAEETSRIRSGWITAGCNFSRALASLRVSLADPAGAFRCQSSQ